MEGRQCWLPAWPIGFSHLNTSGCRTDHALPTATSIINLEHILHIPAMILILSAPGQHCRPIMNSRGHTPGTEQRKTQRKDSEKERCDFENRRKQHRWREKIPFEPSGDKTANMKRKNQWLLPRTNHPTHTGYWSKKSPHSAFKSSHSRALMPSCSPELTLLTCLGLLKTPDNKWYKLKTKFNVWSL